MNLSSVLELSRGSIRNEGPPLSTNVNISSSLDELLAQVCSSRNGHQYSALDLSYRSDLLYIGLLMCVEKQNSGVQLYYGC